MTENYNVDGIILGCAELPLIISSKDTNIPLLDTLDILAEATLNYVLN
ncbi:MAG: aspartate/glutamate racemase family protein [Candidatus Cloacimonetes bacterium]|nr:aspartate/glutamate racemase family protein [Candidatus Cloacimonadota bacterium]